MDVVNYSCPPVPGKINFRQKSGQVSERNNSENQRGVLVAAGTTTGRKVLG